MAVAGTKEQLGLGFVLCASAGCGCGTMKYVGLRVYLYSCHSSAGSIFRVEVELTQHLFFPFFPLFFVFKFFSRSFLFLSLVTIEFHLSSFVHLVLIPPYVFPNRQHEPVLPLLTHGDLVPLVPLVVVPCRAVRSSRLRSCFYSCCASLPASLLLRFSSAPLARCAAHVAPFSLLPSSFPLFLYSFRRFYRDGFHHQI